MSPLPANLTVSSTIAEDSPDYSIADAGALRALSEAELRHFWHLARNRFIEAGLRRLGLAPGDRVVELGCGGGAVAAHLARRGFSVTGVDGHMPRLIEAATRAPQANFVAHDLRTGPPPLPPASFRVACLFDVIEHLEKPALALEGARSLVPPGGLVVGTVPALMSLWSRIDELSGHKTRYSRRRLSEVLVAAPGLEVLELLDFNRQLVPILWVQRRLMVSDHTRSVEENLRVPARPVNGALLGLAATEQLLRSPLEALGVPGASLWFALRRSA